MKIDELTKQFEQISKNYAKNVGIKRDSNWFILKLQEELGELTQSYLMMEGLARKKGKTKVEMREDFEKEIADVFGQLLLLANHYNVDLDKVIKDKWLIWLKNKVEK